jgi:DNA repair protein RadC
MNAPTLTPLFLRRGRRYLPATDAELMTRARALAVREVCTGQPLVSPMAAREFLQLQIGSLEHEVFAVLFLDTRNRVIAFDPMFRGTVDGSAVHPREVVKAALRLNAAAVVIAHNHPSGVAEPSQADEVITMRLRDALQLVEIRLLDHLILTPDGGCSSFAERGLL